MRAAILLVLCAVAPATTAPTSAATWGELGRGPGPSAATAPGPGAAYAPGPAYTPGAAYGPCPPCLPVADPMGRPIGSPLGMEGRPPAAYDAPGAASAPPAWSVPPEALLPMTRDGSLPNGALQMGTFGQINTTTDPYNPWGLSTPFMFVPWSTPLSGWTNAQTWNWWRTRSGVRSPAW
jgi:hypothetical protein